MPNCQRTIDEMMDGAESVTKEAELKEQKPVMEVADVTKPATSPKLDTQVV